jgi:simple sugar transport system permease protein
LKLIFPNEKMISHFLEIILIPIFAVAITITLTAALIYAVGGNPLIGYWSLFYGAFGNVYNVAETLVRTSPLLLTGLGILLAFRCGIVNLGAEGQLHIGAAATAWAGLAFSNIPAPVHILILLLISFIAGGLWGLIPGILKAKFDVSEVLSGLLLNFIAILFVSFLVEGPMKKPMALFPQTPTIAASAQLPKLLPGTRLHAGLIIALLCVALISILLNKSILGYKIRAIGYNKIAARYAGINVSKGIVATMFIAGGLAGWAGMGEVSGVHHSLMVGISEGYGYIAIAAALLGELNPLGTTLTSIFFAGLFIGAETMQRTAGIPIVLIYVIQALVILSTLSVGVMMRGRKE